MLLFPKSFSTQSVFAVCAEVGPSVHDNVYIDEKFAFVGNINVKGHTVNICS